MKRLAILLPVLAAAVAAAPSSDRASAPLVARRAAVDLAETRAGDGFKLRGSYWTGTLRPDRPQIVQVNLFAGNRYCFTAATSGPGGVSVSIYDEAGIALPAETYQDGLRATAEFSPAASGPYLLKISQHGSHASSFCLVYSYK